MANVSSAARVSLQLANGMHHRWITGGEAERMRARNQCRRLRQPGAKSVGRTLPVYRMNPEVEPSQSDATPGAITWFDMQAQLGLVGTREAQAASRVKIRVWPTI